MSLVGNVMFMLINQCFHAFPITEIQMMNPRLLASRANAVHEAPVPKFSIRYGFPTSVPFSTAPSVFSRRILSWRPGRRTEPRRPAGPPCR